MITPTVILVLSDIKARYDSRLTFFWKYRSLSVHMSQIVNALCHCHFDNNLALMSLRYEDVISCKKNSYIWCDILSVTQELASVYSHQR